MNKICLIVSLLMVPCAHLAMGGTVGVLQKYSITSIHLVPMAPIAVTQMYYRGPGPVLVAIIATGPGQEIKETAEKNGIQIDKIATEEIQRALESSHKVTMSSRMSHSPYTLFARDSPIWVQRAPMRLQLQSWCLSWGSNVKIKSADGKSLWKDHYVALPLGNPVAAIKKEDLVQRSTTN